jgi:hypothetical protein
MFYNDQHWRLIKIFKISNSIKHNEFLLVLRTVVYDYKIRTEKGSFNKTERIARLKKIGILANQLLPLIESEHLITQILVPLTWENLGDHENLKLEGTRRAKELV